MDVLITGGNGKIGRSLIEQLPEASNITTIGHHNTAYDDGDRIRSYKLDITDGENLEELFQENHFDAVVHLAALVGQACNDNEEFARIVNVEATRRLGLTAVRHNVKSFVNLSTSAVYYQPKLEPTSEYNNIDPRSTYGETKLDAEIELDKVAIEAESMSIASLRAFNVYGEHFDDSLIEKLLRSTKKKPVPLVGWYNFRRDYVPDNDVVQAIRLALFSDKLKPGKHEVVNVGSGQNWSIGELVTELLIHGWNAHYVRPTQDDIATYTWADIKRARELLNFKPSRNLILPIPPQK